MESPSMDSNNQNLSYNRKFKARIKVNASVFSPHAPISHSRLATSGIPGVTDFRKNIRSPPKSTQITRSSQPSRLRIFQNANPSHHKGNSVIYTNNPNKFFDSETFILSTKKHEQKMENQMDELKNALENMQKENERLRKLSQEIMLDHNLRKDMVSTVHSFYQNVYLHETEMNSENLNKKLTELKQKYVDISSENCKLKAENKRLIATINQYREMARDFQLNKNIRNTTLNGHKKQLSLNLEKINLGNDTTRLISENTEELPDISFANSELTKRNTYDEQITNFDSPRKTSRTTLLENTGKCITKILRSYTLKELIENLYPALDTLYKPYRIGIFIVDSQIRKLFNKEHGLASMFSLAKDSVDLALAEQNHGISPVFNSITILNTKYRKMNSLVIPVSSNNRIFLALQLETKQNLLISKPVAQPVIIENSPVLMSVLEMISAASAKLIENFLVQFEVNIRENYQDKLISFCENICGERNHQKIVQTIEDNVAQIYGFEKANLLLCDKDNLIKLQAGYTEKGEIFTDEIIKYPKNAGLTGKALLQMVPIISQLGKTDSEFSDEVDNVSGTRKIFNILIAPLLLENSEHGKREVMGILHLLNYKNSDIPSDISNDILLLTKIMAKCIDNVNSFSKSFKVMLGLHNGLGNTLEILDEGEKEIGNETKCVGKHLNDQFIHITKLMGDLITSKKTQFLSELCQTCKSNNSNIIARKYKK